MVTPAHDGSPTKRPDLAEAQPEAVVHFRATLQEGKPWQEALLEAMGLWTLPEEAFQGRHYQYLLHGEAFDWLLLAERLFAAADGLVSQRDMERLLLHGLAPPELSHQQLRRWLGHAKYRAVLNFSYGVVAEEALQLAVEEEIQKERWAKGLPDGYDVPDQAALRIYNETRSGLLKRFRNEMGYPDRASIDLTELHEFTYWLFKLRVKNGEPARVASDTRKGLERLRRLRSSQSPF